MMIEDFLRSARERYYNLPSSIRNLVGYSYRSLPYRVRFGSSFIEFSGIIRSGETWSKQEVLDYQYGCLKDTLRVAFRDIPYYRKRFSEFGLSIDDFKEPLDLEKFPTLSKSEIKNNIDDIVNPKFGNFRRLLTTTGGSTSEPMRFYQHKGITRSKEKAFIHDGWRRVGFEIGDRAVLLKGRSVGSPGKGVHWEYEAIQNYLEMDSNYITEAKIPDYLKAMEKFGARFLIGYPSSVYLIAKYLIDKGEPPPKFDAIMLASENLYPWQRDTLERAFKCRIYSHYGHSEMVLLGMEGKFSRNLIFYPQYGYLEIVDSKGKPGMHPGHMGELIGTSFHNFVMPFIRYKTQDFGVVGDADTELPEYPVLSKVEGRLQEFIVTKDQRLISICVMGAAHFDTLDNVSETQYFQETPGYVEFRVVPRLGYTSDDRNRIRQALQNKLGSSVIVTIKEVERIAKTRSGKHMMMIQKVPFGRIEGSQELILSDE